MPYPFQRDHLNHECKIWFRFLGPAPTKKFSSWPEVDLFCGQATENFGLINHEHFGW